ncbi:MAG TPA: hypothetical protein PKE04_21865 [Clostridia bacterium]|nr:hypothetical protein [Clostridia bacterium]
MLNLLNICAHGLILGPILLMVLFNTLKLSFARKNFVRIAALVSVLQLLCTVTGFFAMRWACRSTASPCSGGRTCPARRTLNCPRTGSCSCW